MTTRAKLTVYSALATALASLCLLPLVSEHGWLTYSFVVIAVISAVGAGLRRSPLFGWSIPIAQLLVLLLMMLIGFASSGGLGLDMMRTLTRVFADGVSDIQSYAMPAPATPGLRLILLSAVGLIAVIVDTVAVTYRRAALAGLPLLALFSVGNGLAAERGSWIWFAFAAAGYLLLLFAEGQDRATRWGRIFRGAAGTVSTGTVRPAGQMVGVLALASAVVLSVLVPQSGSGLIGGGSHESADGSGTGVGGISSGNLDPMVSLESAIVKPTDDELFTYTMDSTQADQTYLRTGSLDQFDGARWKLSSTTFSGLPATLPNPEGLRDAAVPRLETDVRIGDRLGGASWLPMPYPAASVSVPNRGEWKLDQLTRTVVPTSDKAIRGLSYHVSSLDLRPTANELRGAALAPQDIRDRYTAVPSEMPAVVAEQAKAITAGAQNDFDRATALVNYFTGPQFKYDTSITPGTGNDAIAVFLRDRRGFCVHYASAMAAMARTLNIPARVAVGFTPGDTKGSNVYTVTGRMYHAWPELYFSGYGWLRFEPTPNRGTPAKYTETTPTPTATPTAQPTSAAPSVSAAPAPSKSSACTGKQQLGDCGPQSKTANNASDGSWLPSWQLLTIVGAGVLVVLLLLAPMFWRTALRRRRLGGGGGKRGPGGPGGGGPVELTDAQVLAAWEELIDSAWDLGLAPDESRTPRSTAQRISVGSKLDAEASAATGRLALATERVMYAPSGRLTTAPVAADVRTVRQGLLAQADRRRRLRALLMPPSSVQLWWRFSDALGVARAAVGERVGRASAAVMTPLRRMFARRPKGPQG
ncbi:transglutaminaseTgpA domain-containing protein [Streptomyces sp. NRRL WC-3742]|uniref:transglutaminase family protein n=1 Tax=Streptomyces sp. NRRL WC-3742 TaxID=1463934 RepID=UPI00068928AE|nr:DUF3488 and transglutaminase-like domain-containing protein [Streptomyces sp. NRRL WC-3742]